MESEERLEPIQTSTMEAFERKRQWLKVINYFRKKTSLQMFDLVLNSPLVLIGNILVLKIFYFWTNVFALDQL